WVGTDNPPPIGRRRSGLEDWRIRNDVDAVLDQRGLVKGSSPSLLVDYGVATEREYTESFSDYGRYVMEGGRGSLADAFVTGYESGTLVIHLYDGRTGQLVWRASATAVVEEGDKSQHTREAIQAMFAKLPRG